MQRALSSRAASQLARTTAAASGAIRSASAAGVPPVHPLLAAPAAAFSSAAAAARPLSPYPAGRDRHLIRPAAAAVNGSTDGGYDALVRSFTWPHVAAGVRQYNIGVDISDKWAADPSHADKPALLYEDVEGDGQLVTCTFAQSSHLSNLLAFGLQRALGVSKGDRVALLLSQSIETALLHTAVYKTGAIAVPLFILFGPEAIEYRLRDSGAKVVAVEAHKLDEVLQLKRAGKLPELQHIIVAPPLSAMRFEQVAAGLASGTGGASPSSPAATQPSEEVAVVHHLSELLARTVTSPGARNFEPVPTLLDDPAVIIYTSGTTGPPKGALHAHRVLLGHLPGVEFPHEFFPQRDDLFWTPADWAWIGGLLDVLLPSLHHGVPVYACRFKKFDAELAFRVIERRKVKNMFLPPTALKMMRGVPNAAQRFPGMQVRSIGSGGESLGEALLEWGQGTFKGVTINEFYGQTECNLVLGNCSTLFPPRAGSMGRAIPGHTVHVVDEATGTPLPDGTVGCIGVKAPHPVMMLRYWNKEQATKDKYAGSYLLTGDLAKRDRDGFFTFFGRADDVIKSAGYRIGPAEIEECLLKHSAVQNVAAVGVPDELRGERVKAYVVLREDALAKLRATAANGSGAAASEEALLSQLRASLAAHVKGALAAYEYPREIEFVSGLPMTPTGKVQRKELKAKHIREHPQGHTYQQQQMQ